MRVSNFRMGIFAAVLISACGVVPAGAVLPGLDDRQWAGHFVGFSNRAFQFGLATDGKAKIEVIGKNDKTVSRVLAVTVQFAVEEVRPDGKTTSKTILPETLESAQAATKEPRDVVFKGKVKGGASFQASIHEERGVISLGGKLLDPGTLTKNPVRFVIHVNFPNAYPHDKDRTAGKKEMKAFEQKTEKDRLQLKWTDGKSRRQSLSDSIDAASKEINGPGIATFNLEFSTYQKKKFDFVASPNSSMTLSNSGVQPLHDGFTVSWLPDPAKDPEGKARLSFQVK
ncbi:MAG: hypothetical protein ABI162_00995 [Luteolibacter sp.]